MSGQAGVRSGYIGDDEEEDVNPATINEADSVTAETPLLGVQDERAKRRAAYRQRIPLLIYLYIFTVMVANGVLAPPATALMERSICKRKFPDVSASLFAGDPRCKDPKVQGSLAMILGWSASLESIPGLIGAIPFGMLSDRVGRRPVLFLSTLGLTLNTMWIVTILYFSDIFVAQWYWLSNAFLFIGGGGPVVVAMLYTIAADVTPADERTTVFFRCGAIQVVAEIVCGPLAGLLMRRSEWLPCMFTVALMVLTTMFSFVFPETLGLHGPDKTVSTDGLAVGEDDVKLSTRMKALVVKGKAELHAVYRFVLGNLRVTFLLLSIVFVVLGKFVQILLLQYATKRYGWSWDDAAILLSIRSICTLLLLVVILPGAGSICINTFKMPPVAKDLWIARVSGIIQILGTLLVACSVDGYMLMGSLVVFAAGGGLVYVIRSLANALVEEHHIGVLNSLIGFMEMAGMLVAGPLLSMSLQKGFELGGAWQGLPFFVATLLFVLATLILWTFRIPHRHLEPVTLA